MLKDLDLAKSHCRLLEGITLPMKSLLRLWLNYCDMKTAREISVKFPNLYQVDIKNKFSPFGESDANFLRDQLCRVPFNKIN